MMMAVDFKLLKSYIQSIFGVSLTPYQIKIVGKILLDDDKRIIITAPTRAGKTLAVSIAILLWVTWKPNSKVVIIAPTYDQTQIIINYIADFLIQSPILANYVDLDVSRKDVSRLKKEFSRSRITFKNGSELLVLSAQGKAERLMGHGADLVVVDESSLISDEVFNLRIMRMLGDDPNAKLLEIGNPFHLNHFYKHWYDPNFTQIHISLEETIEAGRLSPDFVEEMKRTLLPQEFKILYEAQFVEEEENALIPYKDLMWAIKNYNDVKILRNYQIYIGCDIARYGEDKTVISVVKTNQDMFKLVNITVKQKESLMETVGVIVNLIRYYNPDYVGIDDSGLGGGVTDRLIELGHQVSPINFGEKPQVNNRALNRKAEIYLNLQSLFRDHRIVIPNNPFLINQLRPLKLELTSGGKYRINDNQDKSPDYADSLAIACAGILTTQTEWEVLEGW